MTARRDARRTVAGRETARSLGISEEAYATYERHRIELERSGGVRLRSRRRRRARLSPYPALTIAVAIVGLATIGWMLTWNGADSTGSASPGDSAHDGGASGRLIALTEREPEREPTPYFAEQGGTRLYLTVDPAQITAVAFHQASGDHALHMESLVPDADMTLASQLKAVPPTDPNAVPPATMWGGACLRLWRSNRTGQPDTAVDVGADPGTPVLSPVTGTVIEVRPYLLYEKHDDVEIHIRPDGRDDVDVVLIHVQDVTVKAGDRVKGGVTRLAAVRMMSDKIDIQLGGYTTNGGNHVHMQLNRIDAAGALQPTGGS